MNRKCQGRKEQRKTRGSAGMDGAEGCRWLLPFSSSMSDNELGYLRRHLNGVISLGAMRVTVSRLRSASCKQCYAYPYWDFNYYSESQCQYIGNRSRLEVPKQTYTIRRWHIRRIEGWSSPECFPYTLCKIISRNVLEQCEIFIVPSVHVQHITGILSRAFTWCHFILHQSQKLCRHIAWKFI